MRPPIAEFSTRAAWLAATLLTLSLLAGCQRETERSAGLFVFGTIVEVLSLIHI